MDVTDIEVFVKMQNKFRGSGCRVVGSQGGCERRSEAIVKIQKKNRRGGVEGVRSGRGELRVDVNEELKFL